MTVLMPSKLCYIKAEGKVNSQLAFMSYFSNIDRWSAPAPSAFACLRIAWGSECQTTGQTAGEKSPFLPNPERNAENSLTPTILFHLHLRLP